MHRPTRLVPLATILILTVAPMSARAATLDGCRAGTPARAAAELIRPGTSVGTERSTIAGMPTTLAMEPWILPGVRHRLIAVNGSWCDATTGFNAAWRELGKGRGGREMASAYAQLAAAPYFDGVTVRDLRSIAPGVYELTTHARTNGVVARWTIATDRQGIVSATWQATGFGVQPAEMNWEGLTARPGASETYSRTRTGLRALKNIPWRSSVAAPGGVMASKTEADGFTLQVNYSLAPAPLLPTTGAFEVDVIEQMLRAADANYKEYLSWGMHKGWSSEVGNIYINDPLTAYCGACVLVSSEFNIHILSDVVLYLKVAGGYSYPDDYLALSLALGHEMFHNFQNAYDGANLLPIGGAPGSAEAAFSEGTARFQETLHSYNTISNQPKSLEFAQDANGCNGFDKPSFDAAMADPFNSSRSYETCYVWHAYYRAHGITGLIDLLTQMRTSKRFSGARQIVELIQSATGHDIVPEMTAVAEGALTGLGYSWGPAAGAGTVVDWAKGLDRWKPATLSPGKSRSVSLGFGGVMGVAITSTVAVSTPDDYLQLYEVRLNGAASTLTPFASGAVVGAPALGEKVWVVAATYVPTTAVITATVPAPLP